MADLRKDPVSGPIPRNEFAALVEAPFGAALKAIRKFDPMWGREQGARIKWRAEFTREIREKGYAIIEATSEEEATDIACKLKDKDIRDTGSADYGFGWDFESVEPTETAQAALNESPPHD